MQTTRTIRRAITVLVIFFMGFSSALAQGTYTIPGGSTTLGSQDQVDAFAAQVSGYDVIDGNITIDDYYSKPNITDLSFLNNIRSIIGNLTINGCTSIVSVNMSLLTSITGDLEINNCKILKTAYFNNLTTVGGDLILDSNGDIGNTFETADFGNLKTISGGFYFSYNSGLTDLKLDKLEYVGGNFYYTSHDATGSGLIEKIHCDNLTEIGGYLHIRKGWCLKEISFNKLQKIGSYFHFESSPYVESLNLDALLTVGNYFTVFGNTILKSLSLKNLISVGSYFSIYSQGQLKNIYFDKLETVGGYFGIYKVYRLETVDFSALKKVNGYFKVFRNSSLKNILFQNLEQVGGDFCMYKNNTSLNNLLFDKLTTVPGNIYIGGEGVEEYDVVSKRYGQIVSAKNYISLDNQLQTIDELNIPLLATVGGKFMFSNFYDNSTINWGALSSIGDSVIISVAPDKDYCFLPGITTEGIKLSKGGSPLLVAERVDLEKGFCNFNNIYFGDIIIRSQSEADFVATLLQGKTQVWGDIYIGSSQSYQSDPVTDLSSLLVLEVVRGSLHVGGNYDIGNGVQTHYNPSLTSLDGLENITVLTDEIYLEQNSSLLDFCALGNLSTSGALPAADWHIAGNLYNPTVVQIGNSECQSNSVYTGDLYIKNQTEMDALLITLAGKVLIDGSVYIGSPETSPTDPVINLSPLKNIEVIKGSLYLGGDYDSGTGLLSHHNPSLLSLQGLGGLQQITGDFGINNNPGGLSLNGVDHLQIIGATLQLANNNSLLSLNGLESITVCTQVDISNNPKLDVFCALNNLVNTTTFTNAAWMVTGNSFNPTYNDMLIGNCSSGSSTAHVYFGDIYVRTQTEMDNLNTILTSKTIIAGSLYIGSPGNATSDPVTAIKNLSEITYLTGGLFIGGSYDSGTGAIAHLNPELGSLIGFDELDRLGTGLTIAHTPTLMSLNGLDNLSTINSYVDIKDNIFLYDYCSLTGALNKTQNAGFSWSTSDNLYNPYLVDIQAGRCAMDVSDIYFGDIIIKTQSELDAMKNKLLGKTKVLGGVYIGSPNSAEPDAVTDLTNLSSLTEIDNGLHIGGYYDIGNGNANHYNTGLTTLEGLDNIASAGMDLTIGNNTVLVNLDGLSSLLQLGGDILVENNALLEDFCGLMNLINAGYSAGWTVSANAYNPSYADMQQGTCNLRVQQTYYGDLYIKSQANMDALVSTLAGKKYISGNVFIGSPYTTPSDPVIDFSPLGNILEIEKDLWIGGQYPKEGETEDYTHHNPSLENFRGCSSLEWVRGDLHISNNTSKNFTMEGLTSLTKIDGGLYIQNNKYLSSAKGLETIEEAGGTLYINKNASMINLDGFDALINAGMVIVENNSPLFSFCGLDMLVTSGYSGAWLVEGNYYNPTLEQMKAGECCGIVPDEYFVGSLWITTQTEMDIAGIMLSDSVGIVGDVYVGSTAHPVSDPVTDFSPISNIKEITGGLYIGVAYASAFGYDIYENPMLQDLSGLSQLSKLGHLYIEGNPVLPSLKGLGALEQVAGDVYIHQNKSLTKLSGLEQLTTVGKVLYLHQNSELEDIIGLESLESVGGSLDIWENTSLTTLDGLEQLNFVGGGMFLRENTLLSGYCALNKLAEAAILSENTWLAEGNEVNPLWADILEGTYCQDPSKNALSVTELTTEGNDARDVCYTFNGQLFIKLGGRYDAAFKMTLYDMTGKMVYVKDDVQVENGIGQTSLPTLKKGIYLARLINNEHKKYLAIKIVARE